MFPDHEEPVAKDEVVFELGETGVATAVHELVAPRRWRLPDEE